MSTGDFAEVDHGRFPRIGLPEAIYGPGKTENQIVQLAMEMDAQGQGPVLVTRANSAAVASLLRAFPGAMVYPGRDQFPDALATVVIAANDNRPEKVGIVTAGTTDLVVANEAAGTLSACGIGFDLICDVGVAGIHRLLSKIDQIRKFDVVIVVAGMEGAITSVLGGLISNPIIAVPTSTGYGASQGGQTAMMAMLASCAPGVSVVGVDNGFGAACGAIRIINLLSAKHQEPQEVPTVVEHQN